MPITARNICTDAMLEINITDPIDAPSDADLSFVLGKLNRLLDNWNADRQAIYADQFLEFPITPNLNPHTIGLTADTPTWAVTGNRPESIEGIILILSGTDPVARVRLTKRDAQWWQENTVPTITATLPSDWYYDPSWPTGSVYLWPVPTQVNDVQLWVRAILSQLTINDTFSLPPGYQDAITLTLAEDICGAFQKATPPQLPDKARRARARVWSANQGTRRLPMRDAGMPGGNSSGYPNFFWPDGSLT